MKKKRVIFFGVFSLLILFNFQVINYDPLNNETELNLVETIFSSKDLKAKPPRETGFWMRTEVTQDFGDLGIAHWYECRLNGFDCFIDEPGGWGF